MSTKTINGLSLPALRAHMGDWIYYICFMKMQDVAIRISIAEEIHSSANLKSLLQRRLISSNSQKIKTYLLNQTQRFFNAIVVGTYGGNPRWNELSIKSSPGRMRNDLPAFIEGALGILSLEGTEKLFAIDGQHRVVGIREAIKENSDIGKEEVTVIFIPGVTATNRSKDPEGFQRTRRLFTTLNRYAKPVNKKDIIALDEDDLSAILTRRLVEENSLFMSNKISIRGSSNIPSEDKTSLTTITALYDSIEIIFKNNADWKSNRIIKSERPEDSIIESFYSQITELFDILIRKFPYLKVINDATINTDIASRFRHNDGGILFYRPIGFLLIFRVIRKLIDSGNSIKKAIDLIARVPMELSDIPWKNLLWDSTNKRMITAPENQKAALKLLLYSVGGDLTKMRSNELKLKSEISGLLRIDKTKYELPRYTMNE